MLSQSFYWLSWDPLVVMSPLQTDCPDFTLDKARAQLVGSEVSIEVSFEPHQLGVARGQLSLSSAVGGDYVFPLEGLCLPPEAQGPFRVGAGRTVSIPFKNVLLQAATFSLQVKDVITTGEITRLESGIKVFVEKCDICCR